MIKIENIHIGKVRHSVILNNSTRIVETSDRISAFDFIFPFQIAKKGEILQALSLWNFEKTKHIIDNHIIGVLDERHILVKNAHVFPVEIIVRGYLTGSLWRLYKNKGSEGVFEKYGVKLEGNLELNHKFPTPIVTPTTKAAQGHDTPITCQQAENLVGSYYWQTIVKKAKELFLFGAIEADKKGLVLVDTKYEMGIFEGQIILLDEVHTPDSSRYWYKNDSNIQSPKQVSKEFLREELIKILGEPESIEESPVYHPLMKDFKVTSELASKVSARYWELFSAFTGLNDTSEIYQNCLFVRWPISKETFSNAIQSSLLPEKICVVGNGGRDYTLFLELSKLAEVNLIYCASGNRNWKSSKYQLCPAKSVEEVSRFAKEQNVGLIIAGPEAPIAEGLEKYCSELEIPVLAPSLNCASLETSKILCKKIIESAGVCTAKSKILKWSELKMDPAVKPQDGSLTNYPFVIKYDSLASGKGVFIIKNVDDFNNALQAIENNLPEWVKLENQIRTPTYSKQAGEPCFLIEEMIVGEEFSAIALCNKEEFRLLPIAKDYKRRNNAQQGPNTGGMGSMAPVTLTEELLNQVKLAFSLTLKELSKRNTPYYGFLFAGFMVNEKNEAYLLEYNCRLGDPETQVIIPSLGRDFYREVFRTAKKEPFFGCNKSGSFFDSDSLKRIFVVGASPEYPNKTPPKRKIYFPEINNINHATLDIIPSALELENMTSGGRAFGILSTAQSFEEARKSAYDFMEKCELENADGSRIRPHYRTDIGT